MPVNASSPSTHVGDALSALARVAPGATVAVVVAVIIGVSSTRARSNVVVAWQGASSP